MLADAINGLKTGLMSMFKSKADGGKHDELDTVVRGLVSKLVKSVIAGVSHKFHGIEENTASVVGTAAVITGWVLRKVTNLGPVGDNLVTDIAQEISDVINEVAKNPKDDPAKVAEKKKLMTNIAKLLINAQIRYARQLSVEDFFFEFNDLMSRMDEKGQAAFVEMVSKFNVKQMYEFITMPTETKEAFFGSFFVKDAKPSQDKKGIKEIFNEAKRITGSVVETIGEGLKKFDDQFKPGGQGEALTQSVTNWLNKLGK